jgi:hypothetical protein
MTTEEFKRLNTLSEKAMANIATPNELEEFRQLLNIWSNSPKYNLLQDFFSYNSGV